MSKNLSKTAGILTDRSHDDVNVDKNVGLSRKM